MKYHLIAENMKCSFYTVTMFLLYYVHWTMLADVTEAAVTMTAVIMTAVTMTAVTMTAVTMRAVNIVASIVQVISFCVSHSLAIMQCVYSVYCIY